MLMSSNKSMEINRSNIYELVNRCQVKPDKDYGQNFLLEPAIASKISEQLELSKTDKVLEIGPGLGSLTHFLAGNCDLTVCDIDSRMVNFLKIFYKDDIKYILNDIRKVDVSSYDKIIGNLPYNITTELVIFLLMNASNAKKMTLMCQLEAYNRFNDLSGENYGPASVLLHLLGTTEKVLVVKPGSFYPAPKCNSIVFNITIKSVVSLDTAIKVYKFSKALFLNRRKTIYNNLKNYLSSGDKALEILNKLGLDQNLRPENISPEIYLKMYQLIQK